MRLYTCFRAQEKAKFFLNNSLLYYEQADIQRRTKQAVNLRDGLIRRMERLELRNALLEDRVLQLLSSEFDGEQK